MNKKQFIKFIYSTIFLNYKRRQFTYFSQMIILFHFEIEIIFKDKKLTPF